MMHGKPANKQERLYIARTVARGCLVCRNLGYGFVPCAFHHLVEGGKRLGHMYGIGLCDPGHHQNSPDPNEISRHPNKAEFERRYGSEWELLEQNYRELGMELIVPETKIVRAA